MELYKNAKKKILCLFLCGNRTFPLDFGNNSRVHFFCGLRQIELAAVGKRYYGGGFKIQDPNYQFCYKGKIYESSYTDLWK